MQAQAQNQPTGQLDLRRYAETLWRKKWLVTICIAAFVISAFVFNQSSTPAYEAIATILLTDSKKPGLAFETAKSMLGKSAVFNLIEQLKSRSMAEELAAALPERVRKQMLSTVTLEAGLAPERALVPRLQECLQVEILPGSDILQIKVEAEEPALAATLANAFIAQLSNWNATRKQKEISGSLEYLERQLLSFQTKLQNSEEKLRAFKQQNHLTSLSETSSENLRRLTDAEVNYNAARADRAALEQRRQTIEQQRQEVSPGLASRSNSDSEALKKRLTNLESRLATMEAAGVGRDDADWLRLQAEKERVKQQLIEELLSSSQHQYAVDSYSQMRALVQEDVELEVELETNKAKEASLQQIIDGYHQDMASLPEQEMELARLLRERDVNEKIYSALLEKREELRLQEAGKFGEIQVLDAAQAPLFSTKPNKPKNFAIAIFLGFSLGALLALICDSFDTSLKSQLEVENCMNLPVLTVIPSIVPLKDVMNRRGSDGERSYNGKLLSHLQAGSHVYQAYRSLQVKFAYANSNRVLNSILVTSASPAEGKTLTSINMALAFAAGGVKTLLVDCDLRRPMIHNILGINQYPGLSDMLQNQVVSIPRALSKWAVTVPASDHLHALPCGTPPANPYELLNSGRMRDVLREAQRQYDLIILDSPPLMSVTDSLAIGNEVDGVCLVIKAGKTRPDQALRAKQLLENCQTNVIGAILNDIDDRRSQSYYVKNDLYLN